MRLCLLLSAAVLFALGCAAVVELPPPPPDHPASPQAEEAPLPVYSHTLPIGVGDPVTSPPSPPTPETKGHHHH